MQSREWFKSAVVSYGDLCELCHEDEQKIAKITASLYHEQVLEQLAEAEEEEKKQQEKEEKKRTRQDLKADRKCHECNTQANTQWYRTNDMKDYICRKCYFKDHVAKSGKICFKCNATETNMAGWRKSKLDYCRNETICDKCYVKENQFLKKRGAAIAREEQVNALLKVAGKTETIELLEARLAVKKAQRLLAEQQQLSDSTETIAEERNAALALLHTSQENEKLNILELALKQSELPLLLGEKKPILRGKYNKSDKSASTTIAAAAAAQKPTYFSKNGVNNNLMKALLHGTQLAQDFEKRSEEIELDWKG